MSRIARTFARLKREQRTALMPYLMVGYPERDSVLELAPALAAAGADLFELGVPFSDPLADGATIQRASQQALANNVTLPYCIETAATLRARGISVPLVMMGYYNPFLQYGIEQLCVDAAAAGIDGFIIPDLPPEEAQPCLQACHAVGLDFICFLAPTSSAERIAKVAEIASGFIYCVALTGTTGARQELWEGLPAFLQRIRHHTDLPLVVGFGISNAAHVQQVSAYADGAIVASALINTIEQLPSNEYVDGLADVVCQLKSGTIMTDQ
ncbi:MAG: tryptophan synthase subunit alpha [Chloroflexi bacterium AL-W]|nr:tryptophan synthase subunit alpha [Chloroflexi bacterium AL-N1]NOK67277.1 tryptophan synthase subunit alpha [Chloroflexi bacterium AL-N10]NOK75229.1 tryptophan synthase subunit alpha [Chloroflexi bacterium AL-N5]NOK82017.1 tryptophan synthase subunit alpha [Chloroflexi bacterium AL-W]NOK89862.1 tryptophan synthase subunit alpha [Chloroflexi bacterium AL-N15]